VIRQPKGNMLLLGVGGSGRQSVTRLAAFMADYRLHQIEIRKGFGKSEWLEELRKVVPPPCSRVLREAVWTYYGYKARGFSYSVGWYGSMNPGSARRAVQVLKMSGLDGQQTVFLFSDTQVVHEYFLEDINNILNRGEVPNIFDPSDMDLITAAMRPVNQSLGLPLDKTALYAQFLKRVQANIHICLAMSPIGEAFRSRLRMFPSLVNCCTLDWFTEWPDEALQSVAQEAFSTIYFANGEQIEGDDEGASKSATIKNAIALTAQFIHQSVSVESKRFLAEERRHNHVTPTSYLELLAIFRVLLAARRTELGTAKRRLTVGLDKLQTTEKEVKLLQDTLEKNQPVLIKTTAEVEAMMVSISADKASHRTFLPAAFALACARSTGPTSRPGLLAFADLCRSHERDRREGIGHRQRESCRMHGDQDRRRGGPCGSAARA
jgi:dynein heavy chain